MAILKLILLVAVLAGIPAFLYFRYGTGIFSRDTADRLLAYLRLNRHIAFPLLIGLQVLQVVICILPGQPIQFASSYMFGVAWGLVFSVIGAVIGTVISFWLSRALGSDALHLLFGEEKLTEYRRRLNSGRGLLLAFLIYLIPGIPKDLVSYAAGISGMSFWPFLMAATAGRIPGMLGSLLLGHFFGRQNYRAMIIMAGIVAVLMIICIFNRARLIELLDMIEAKDAERRESKEQRKMGEM